ncbi:MAG: hypothetical protein QFF03_05355 [Pseudomonadota bacterium]|nr:hypothetical protein [Pseudomonadota bacterium]
MKESNRVSNSCSAFWAFCIFLLRRISIVGMMNQKEKAEHFGKMHIPGRPLVLFNAWGAGSAKAVGAAGARDCHRQVVGRRGKRLSGWREPARRFRHR